MKVIKNEKNKLTIKEKIFCSITSLSILIGVPAIIFSIQAYKRNNQPNPTIVASLNLTKINITIHADRDYKEIRFQYYCFNLDYQKINTGTDSIKSLNKGNDYIREYTINPVILLETVYVTAKIVEIK